MEYKLGVLVLVMLVSFTICDLLLPSFFKSTNAAITEIFQKFEGRFITGCMWFASYMLPVSGYIYILCTYYTRSSKFDSIFSMFSITSAIYFNGVLKLVYRDGRPFVVSEGVKALECECSFGKPSGHA
jgi:hypothetical protein